MDSLRRKLEHIKKISASASRRTNLYSDLAEFEHKPTSNSLRALRKASAPGGKMQKVGFLMLWIPEPTGITCAVGGPMIIAGKYLDRVYNGSTIHDIAHHTKKTRTSINEFKKTLS
jgi:hypothetical protein